MGGGDKEIMVSVRKMVATLLMPVLAVLAVLAVVSCAKPISVGVVVTQSGAQSSLGNDIRDGILLARDELAAGRGAKAPRFELVVRDDEGDPAKAFAIDEELLEAGARLVIGHATSGLTQAVLPLFDERRIPLVSPTASSRAFSGLDDYFFRLVSSNAQESRSLAAYARERMGRSRAVLVVDVSNQAYGGAWTADFVEAFRASGGSVSRLEFDSSAKPDLGVLLTRSSSALGAADCVVFVCAPTDLAFIAQALRRDGWSGAFLSSGWAKSPDTVRLGGSAVEGLVCSEMFDQANEEPAYAAFREKFIGRYGREPTGAAVQGYEALLFVHLALAADARDPLEGLKAVRAMDGLQGRLEFDEYGDAVRPSFFVRVEEGAFLPVPRS